MCGCLSANLFLTLLRPPMKMIATCLGTLYWNYMYNVCHWNGTHIHSLFKLHTHTHDLDWDAFTHARLGNYYNIHMYTVSFLYVYTCTCMYNYTCTSVCTCICTNMTLYNWWTHKVVSLCDNWTCGIITALWRVGLAGIYAEREVLPLCNYHLTPLHDM